MSYRMQRLACIVPFVLLTGCATPPLPLAEVKAPTSGCNEPPPVYPAEARRARAEGRVVVSAVIEADGTVSEAKVSESSGNALLDGVALHAVQSTRCAPFKDPETGHAMRVSFSKPFVFSTDGATIRTAALSPDLSAATLAYAEKVRAKVRSNLLVSDGNLPSDISAVVRVLLGPDGAVLRATLQKSSGVTTYDDAVLKAIERSSPLPLEKPGQVGSRTIVLTFKP
ncbi:TonB family protein [Ralstonia sp. ASV6]|uniref:TonB family protein n=1 Tax=Ralstonia sp. ASV6 TaxID=2795124 RepID=UPI0018ED7760|nr:TonB family protein [Ralstonia sp. ASV6]